MAESIKDQNECFLCQTDHPGRKLSCPSANPVLKKKPDELRRQYTTQTENIIQLNISKQLPSNLALDDVLCGRQIGDACHGDGNTGGGIDVTKTVDCML